MTRGKWALIFLIESVQLNMEARRLNRHVEVVISLVMAQLGLGVDVAFRIVRMS